MIGADEEILDCSVPPQLVEAIIRANAEEMAVAA